jgi:spermidine synthase
MTTEQNRPGDGMVKAQNRSDLGHLSAPVAIPKAPSKSSLYLMTSVFLAGIGIMSAEMAAPRLLAPSFGTTQIIWTNIIGTVLIAMTLGAFTGGRLADKWPTERAYARVFAIAGLLLAVVPLVSRPVLMRAAEALTTQHAGTFLLSLLTVCLFFAPPVFLLGMIGPWAVRLAGANRPDLGRIAGILSGLSALGSILGTFLSSLVAMPLLGTRRTLIATAGLLLVTGAWRAFDYRAWMRFSGIVVALGLMFVPWGKIKADSTQIYEAESFYQYIEVVESADGWRYLLLNEGHGQHSVMPPTGYLIGGYWDDISVLPAMTTKTGDSLRVLILGLAGGTMARQLEHFYGNTRALSIDGVEIDPGVVEAGRKFFGLGEVKSLKIHIADARPFLNMSRGTYELIVADAFRQPYIPFHMVTKEFYKGCLDRLSPNGVFAINLGADPASTDLIDAFTATLKSVFPYLYRVTVRGDIALFTNFVYVGSRNPLVLGGMTDLSPELWPVFTQMHKTWEMPRAADNAFVFTDDHSPIELFTERMILRAALSGR